MDELNLDTIGYFLYMEEQEKKLASPCAETGLTSWEDWPQQSEDANEN